MKRTPVVKFSQNWNGKLNNTIFTTIRLNSGKYVKDKVYRIVQLEGDYTVNSFLAKIVHISSKRIYDFSFQEIILDTGMDYKSSLKLFHKFYPNVDFSNQLFDYLTLEKIKEGLKK